MLLVALLVCHYLADYCLTMPSMIKAKADGCSPWPILLHTFVHALLIGICLLIWGVAWGMLLLLMLAELISHFLIDTGKGCQHGNEHFCQCSSNVSENTI